MVLFSRTEHGGRKVEILDSGFEVDWPQGSVHYPNARQLIIALVNQEPKPGTGAKDPHLTFDRYFRRGRYQLGGYPQEDTLSMFKDLTVSGLRSNINPTGLIVHVPKPNVGIDFEKRGHEVAKLFYAGFANTARRKGWDLAEVLQEVYKALLIRNVGKCPWDPAKSSFGHYVHMVIRGVMSNYGRKYSRVYGAEVYGTNSSSGETIDVAESSLARCESSAPQVDMHKDRSNLHRFLLTKLTEEGLNPVTVEEVLTRISEGHTQKDIAKDLKLGADKVSLIVRRIRAVASEWRNAVSKN